MLIEPSQRSSHGTWIEIRLDRLLANLKAIHSHAAFPCEVLAVIKANAYGHGLLPIARALGNRVAYLGISSLAEAVELKEHGIETPLFLFGCYRAPEIQTLLCDGITLSLSSLEEAQEISALSKSLGRKTPVHIKVDTGMGRLGIPYREAFKTIEKIAGLPGLIAEGIYTHFPTAELADGFAEQQLREFAVLLEELERIGIQFRYRHASNSAASLSIHSPVLNVIRPGIMLYGIYPEDSLRRDISLSPILSLKSRILFLKKLLPGESSGYGRDFVASRPTTIAVLPIGYSHGYPFSASNRASVLFRGKRFPTAGRVSMDYLCFDLGDTTARVGEEVTLLGEDGENFIETEELARWSDTIPYEIVTRLSSRLPRFYRP